MDNQIIEKCAAKKLEHENQFDLNRTIGRGVAAGIMICSTISAWFNINTVTGNKKTQMLALMSNVACIAVTPYIYRIFDRDMFKDLEIASKYDELISRQKMFALEEPTTEKREKFVQDYENLRKIRPMNVW